MHARCLDISRLISRVGRGPNTGVDRVELAYLRFFLRHPDPFFAFARTSLGFVLLDRDGTERILDRLDGRSAWGPMDWIGRLRLRAARAQRAAEADLRRHAIARCRPNNLAQILKSHTPKGCRYINVGHSNLSDAVLSAWNRVENGQVTVLIHDMIPLDFPQFQRDGTAARFEEKMRLVARHADHVICISQATQMRVADWFSCWGHDVTTTVAHLGVDAPPVGEVPSRLGLNRPYFVTLGTIEPRKNHALLLDIWQELGPDAPYLVIAGARGWRNEAVFARLDARPANVIEAPGLSDAEIGALLMGARGLLFPSLAEGFGLPPAEAIALGTPVICSDLSVLREILGNIPIYANADDMYLWKQSILHVSGQTEARRSELAATANALPAWVEHFNTVLKVT